MKKEKFQEALRPLAKGLFGPYSSPYTPPSLPLYPLEDMLRDLVALEPADWTGYVFSREPLNGKLTEGQRQRWMEEGLACGREYAMRLRGEYGSSDSEAIAKAMGMMVEYPTLPEKTDRVLFAEFREQNTIRIYMDAVKKAKKLLEQPQIGELLTRELQISRLLLAHELFHAVEERYKKEIYTYREKIRLWSLGPFHNDSHIIAVSEIAAMGFAWELTKIPYAPWVMDVFLVYGYSPREAGGLYEEILSYAGKR